MKKTNALIWNVINILGFVGVVIVNALANILPLNGKQTGDLSDAYPNLFVPAGLTFSIWGLIYILLAAFVVYGLIITLKNRDGIAVAEALGPLFLLSSVFNAAWIFAWHWEMVFLSLCFMLLLLLSLIFMYLRLEIGKTPPGRGIRFFIRLPVSVYLGWITVATIANVTALLVDAGWSGLGIGEGFWTVFVIAAAVIITQLVLFIRHDAGYALVVVWALLGIFIKRRGIDVPPDLAVEIAAAAGIIITVFDIVYVKIKSRGSGEIN